MGLQLTTGKNRCAVLSGRRDSKATTAALAARAHWLTIEWLPKYAPELNDIEVVWHDLRAKPQSVGPTENLCLGDPHGLRSATASGSVST